MKYNFIGNDVLYAEILSNDAEKKSKIQIADFFPEVTAKDIIVDLNENNKESMVYTITVKAKGDVKAKFQTSSLNNIDFFKIAGIPDAMLSKKDHQLISYKLQLDSVSANEKKMLRAKNGLYFYQNEPIFVLGGIPISKCKTLPILTDTSDSYTDVINDSRSDEEIAREVSQYISFIPHVSLPLFYYSMLAILKPFYVSSGYNFNFILAVLGASGMCKTSVVEKFSLWQKIPLNMEVVKKDTNIRKLMPKFHAYRGMNFLIDDFHRVQNSYRKSVILEEFDSLTRLVSSDKNMPNVITTGEELEGITSCLDRLCILYDTHVFDRDIRDERIRVLKNIPNTLFFLAAYRFCRKLISDYDEVIKEIRVMQDNSTNETSHSRVAFHNRLIYETAILYEKYMCCSNRTISRLDELQTCFEYNLNKQQNVLERLREFDRQNTIDWVLIVYKSVYILYEKKQCVDIKNFDPIKHFAFVKNNIIYIKDNMFGYFLQLSSECTPNERKAIDELEKLNLLSKDDARHRKRRHNNQWYYAIRIEPLKLYYNRFGV